MSALSGKPIRPSGPMDRYRKLNIPEAADREYMSPQLADEKPVRRIRNGWGDTFHIFRFAQGWPLLNGTWGYERQCGGRAYCKFCLMEAATRAAERKEKNHGSR